MRLLLGAVSAVNRLLRARLGLLGAPLGGPGLLLGTRDVVARAMRALLRRAALAIVIARFLEHRLAFALGLDRAGDRLIALLLSSPSTGNRLLDPLPRFGRGGLGHPLRRGGRVAPRERVSPKSTNLGRHLCS